EIFAGALVITDFRYSNHSQGHQLRLPSGDKAEVLQAIAFKAGTVLNFRGDLKTLQQVEEERRREEEQKLEMLKAPMQKIEHFFQDAMLRPFFTMEYFNKSMQEVLVLVLSFVHSLTGIVLR